MGGGPGVGIWGFGRAFWGIKGAIRGGGSYGGNGVIWGEFWGGIWGFGGGILGHKGGVGQLWGDGEGGPGEASGLWKGFGA